MKAPSPPPTPDPYKTAGAQQMANVEVAVANTALQNADEDRPDGSVRFEEIPIDIATHTYDGNGNVTGTRYIRRWKKTTALNAKGASQFDQQQDLAIKFNEVALQQASNMQVQLENPILTSQLIPRPDHPTAPTLDDSSPTPGALVTSIDPGDLTEHIQTIQDALDSRIEYQIQIDRDLRITRLKNMGILPGSEAYDRDLYSFDRQATDARFQALLAARSEETRIVQTKAIIGDFANKVQNQIFNQGILVIDVKNRTLIQQFSLAMQLANYVNMARTQDLQERISIRAQIVNEVSGLMHGGQVTVPQFQPFRADHIGQTPVAQSVYQSAAMDMQKWQMQVQQQQSLFGGMMGLGGSIFSSLMMSDERLKTDIAFEFADPRGFNWYTWRYVWDALGVRRLGVMAQEILLVKPSAVVPIGEWLAVDYGML